MTTNIVELKKIMVEKGIKSVAELARISNVSRSTLSSVLNGEAQPSRDVMVKLVIALEIPPQNAGGIFFCPEVT